MIRQVFVSQLLVVAVLANSAMTSCARKPRDAGLAGRSVTIEPHRTGFSLALHLRQLEGQCYTPTFNQLNPSLFIDGFTGGNRWVVVSVSPSKVEGLDDILRARRERIGGTTELTVPRDNVATRPFFIQFVAFPCDAPATARNWNGKVAIVSISADLPTFYPPGYREPGSGNATDLVDGMMTYDAPGNIATR